MFGRKKNWKIYKELILIYKSINYYRTDLLLIMSFKCACGKNYNSRQALSKHGIKSGKNQKGCPIYQERKEKKQQLNVYNINIINNNNTNNKNTTVKKNKITNNIFNSNNIDVNKISKDIINKVKNYFNERELLKKEIVNYEYDYIYLIREFVFVKRDIPLYKIGRTYRKPEKRIAEYPKGSEVFLLMKSNHSKRDETRLLNKFNIKFERRNDEGNEYFLGDPFEMVEMILEEIVNKRWLK